MYSGHTKEVLLIALKPPGVEEGQADIDDLMAANFPLLFVSANAPLWLGRVVNYVRGQLQRPRKCVKKKCCYSAL